MKRRILLPLIFSALFAQSAITVSAAEPPLVFDRENTANGYPALSFPAFNELTYIETLPDPFLLAGENRRTTDYADWEQHRSEILQQLRHYEVGELPAPDSIRASFARDTLTVSVFAGGEELVLHSPVVYPAEGNGPFPVVIGVGFPTGSLPSELFLDNGVAAMAFNFPEVMSHTQTRGTEPVNRLFPDHTDVGAYCAWPWGISRLIDGLARVAGEARINLSHIAVTGCSFAGKMALFAGAMDERIALTIAQEPGGGGVNAWRVSETLGNVETIGRTNYAWFLESMRRFAEGSVGLLPVDHHQLAALVAPRALLIIGNTDYEWLADESGYVSARAAREVWRTFGIADRMGYTIEGGHMHCQLPPSQRPEVEAFIRRFLLGDTSADTNVARAPMFDSVDCLRWLPWAK